MSPITTHILDTARGCPAAGVAVHLDAQTADGGWQRVGEGHTDDDGRFKGLMAPGTLTEGVYRISFDTAGYYRAINGTSFYPEVQIAFEVRAADEHYHVPLLLSPFGYSTYRGS